MARFPLCVRGFWQANCGLRFAQQMNGDETLSLDREIFDLIEQLEERERRLTKRLEELDRRATEIEARLRRLEES